MLIEPTTFALACSVLIICCKAPHVKMALMSRFFLLLILSLGAASSSHAQQFSYSPNALFPLADLRKGDFGYGITASEGNRLEYFSVEVLALQRRYINEQPAILVRVGGDLIEQTGGLAAGMSGSPVYLEHGEGHKLLGAIGYTFPNSDHTLGLVTPFQVMQGDFAAVRSALAENPMLDAGALVDMDIPDMREARAISTPLLISGLDNAALPMLEQLFADSVISPLAVQSGSLGSGDDDADFILEAGSAISVPLVRGDISISALGTLTHIEKTAQDTTRFYAFGHPLLALGEVDFALVPAYVSYIVPSTELPFKLSNSGEALLGSIRLDNDYGVQGLLQYYPNYIPVNVTINGPQGSSQYSFKISADERLYSPLLAAASLQALQDTLGQRSAGSAEIAWEISLRQAGANESQRLRVLEQSLDDENISLELARLLATPLNILAHNIYADVEIERVNISINWQDRLEFTQIVDASSEIKKVAAGSTLPIFVRLQHYRQEPEVIELAIPIPEDAEGTVRLVIRGGNEVSERSDDNDDEVEDPILSFEELLVSIREQVQASELVVEAYLQGEAQRLLRRSFAQPIVGKTSLLLKILDSDDTASPAPVSLPPQEDSSNEPDSPLPETSPPSQELGKHVSDKKAKG